MDTPVGPSPAHTRGGEPTAAPKTTSLWPRARAWRLHGPQGPRTPRGTGQPGPRARSHVAEPQRAERGHSHAGHPASSPGHRTRRGHARSSERNRAGGTALDVRRGDQPPGRRAGLDPEGSGHRAAGCPQRRLHPRRTRLSSPQAAGGMRAEAGGRPDPPQARGPQGQAQQPPGARLSMRTAGPRSPGLRKPSQAEPHGEEGPEETRKGHVPRGPASRVRLQGGGRHVSHTQSSSVTVTPCGCDPQGVPGPGHRSQAAEQGPATARARAGPATGEEPRGPRPRAGPPARTSQGTVGVPHTQPDSHGRALQLTELPPPAGPLAMTPGPNRKVRPSAGEQERGSPGKGTLGTWKPNARDKTTNSTGGMDGEPGRVLDSEVGRDRDRRGPGAQPGTEAEESRGENTTGRKRSPPHSGSQPRRGPAPRRGTGRQGTRGSGC